MKIFILTLCALMSTFVIAQENIVASDRALVRMKGSVYFQSDLQVFRNELLKLSCLFPEMTLVKWLGLTEKELGSANFDEHMLKAYTQKMTHYLKVQMMVKAEAPVKARNILLALLQSNCNPRIEYDALSEKGKEILLVESYLKMRFAHSAKGQPVDLPSEFQKFGETLDIKTPHEYLFAY